MRLFKWLNETCAQYAPLRASRSSGVQFLSDLSWANLLLSLPHKLANPCSMKASFLSLQMNQSLQAQWSWNRLFMVKSLSHGLHLQTRRKTIDCITLLDERDSNTRVWRTIADRLFCNHCLCPIQSRIPESMQKNIWDFLIHLNRQRGVLTNWEVGCWREQTN